MMQIDTSAVIGWADKTVMLEFQHYREDEYPDSDGRRTTAVHDSSMYATSRPKGLSITSGGRARAPGSGPSRAPTQAARPSTSIAARPVGG